MSEVLKLCEVEWTGKAFYIISESDAALETAA